MAPRPGPPLAVSVFRDEQRVEWQHVVNLAAGSDDCPPLGVNPNINAGMHVDSCEHETCLHAASMCSILVISSDAAARERWSRALQSRGRQAVVLPPGVDARTTSTQDLDAIVVDVELSGDWQHLRVLAENRTALRAPLIVMTSWTAPDGRYRRMAFQIGCDAFAAKPFSPEAMLEIVERLSAGEREIHAGGER